MFKANQSLFVKLQEEVLTHFIYLKSYIAMLKVRLAICFFFLALIVTSCKNEEKVNPDNPLIARAGTDQQVKLGQTVTLDGSASTESKNRPFDFSWQLIKKPIGSKVTLESPKTAKATFVPDEEGEYEAELTISNAEGSSTDKVLINATAAEPEELNADIKVKTILVNRISNPAFPDYVVTKNIGVNAELVINPGVVIAFARDLKLEINDKGVITAKGTADKRIRFEGREKTRAFWTGIVNRSASSANEFDYVDVLHAGSKPLTNTIKGGLLMVGGYKAQLSIKNSTFTTNEGVGLYVEEGASIRGFGSNTFKDNTASGILLDMENVGHLDENSIFTGGNGRDVVEINGSSLVANNVAETTWAVFKDKTPYRFVNNISVRGSWKLLPGTILEFARDKSLYVENNGYMNAIGTKENRIIIRGVENGNGFWRGILFSSNSPKNIIEYTDITGGGSAAIVSGMKANVAAHGTGARIEIKNSLLANSGGYGFYISYLSICNADMETINTYKDNVQGEVYRQK
jgi:hypothetical protein